MDFLDDLDKAFDAMFTPEEGTESDVGLDDHLGPDVSDLRTELTREHLVPVAVLAATMDCFQRRYLLAALAGGLDHLAAVDHDPQRIQLMSELAGLLRTGRGAIRKVMSKTARRQLKQLLGQLGDPPGEGATHEAGALLLALQQGGIPLETVYALFQSGINHPGIMAAAPDHEIAHITHLSQDAIAAAKALFAPDTQ